MRLLCLPLFPLLSSLAASTPAPDTRQATGVKVGEVSATSAIVWVRVSAGAQRNPERAFGPNRPAGRLPPGVEVSALEGACPGAAGLVRLRYGPSPDLAAAAATDWLPVDADRDFTRSFTLSGLEPGSVYHYSVETASPSKSTLHGPLRGRFKTAPPPDSNAPVAFTVITGQAYRDLDHPEGFLIYDAMAELDPDFLVATGDTVYYDSDSPRATTPGLARYHWHRMYSLPRLVAFHLRVPAYWIKDDHDTLADDCWPGRDTPAMLPMTFEEGARIFREQVPMGAGTYRTVRWGRGLQVWLVEGRDFRSANPLPDGPGKTIWGGEQKRWLEDTLLAAAARWKILISPTPIVGPDRANKADNHCNTAFASEGDEIRRWIGSNLPGRCFVVCGDRHWQYHSVHPETGLHEFSCGPASNRHAGGTPGEDPRYHRFHRVQGGFLSVTVAPRGDESSIAFRFHDVAGNVVYEYTEDAG